MAARKNPNKNLVLGVSVLALAGIGAYYFFGRKEDEPGDQLPYTDALPSGPEGKAIQAVGKKLQSQGKNPKDFDLRAQPHRSGGFQVQARHKKKGNVYRFSVRPTGEVKVMKDAASQPESAEPGSRGKPQIAQGLGPTAGMKASDYTGQQPSTSKSSSSSSSTTIVVDPFAPFSKRERKALGLGGFYGAVFQPS